MSQKVFLDFLKKPSNKLNVPIENKTFDKIVRFWDLKQFLIKCF